MTVRKSGSKFKLISSSGKVLGTHNTRAGAEKQESAIQISKARAKGKRIPKKRK